MGGTLLPRRRLSDDEINQLVPPGLSESDIQALVPPTPDEQAVAARSSPVAPTASPPPQSGRFGPMPGVPLSPETDASSVLRGALGAIPQFIPGTVQFAKDVGTTLRDVTATLDPGATAGQRLERGAKAGRAAYQMAYGFLEPVADVAALPFEVPYLTDAERRARLGRAGGTLMGLGLLRGGDALLRGIRKPGVGPVDVPAEAVKPAVPPPTDYGTGALADRRVAAGLPAPTAEGFDPAIWRRANDPRPEFRRTQAAPAGPGSIDIYHREQGGKPVPPSAAPELESAQSSVSRETSTPTVPGAPGRPVVARSAGGPTPAPSLSPSLAFANERGSVPGLPDPLEAQVNLKGLPDHSRAIQAQISVGAAERHLPTLSDLYSRLVRRTYPIEKAAQTIGGSDIPTARDPGVAALLSSGSPARAESFLEDGPFRLLPDGNTELTGTPSYKAILAPLRGQLNAYRRYEIATHTLDLAAKETPIETGIHPELAAREVAGVTPAVKRAHEQSVQYRNAVLDYWQEAGGVSPEAAAGMKAMYQNYVPLNRVFEGKDVGAGAGRIGRVAQQIKRLVGSRRAILDPIETTVDQTRRLVTAADRQRVGKLLVELAEQFPEQAKGLVEQAARPSVRALSQDAARLQSAAAARGVPLTLETAAEIAGQLSDRSLNVADDVIRVWRDGKVQEWRVAPEIGKAMRSMSPEAAKLWAQLIGLPAQGLKVGITANPAFAVFNLVRDTFDATLQSQYGFRLGLDSLRGFAEAMKRGPFYREFRQGGGDYSGFYGGTRRNVQAEVRRLVPEAPARAVLGRVLHPLEALKAFGRPFEEAGRLGEFMRARQQGAPVLKSSLAAMNVTTNFRQIGADMQGLAQMTAFLNPGIQSIDTAIRVARRNPGRLMLLGTAAISLPSLYLWAANRGDQEITDLRKTNAGLLYWFVRLPDGQIGRIPKPFFYGQFFGTGMEAALDKTFDADPAAGDRFAQGLAQQAGSNVIPNSVQTYFALKDNKDPFFGTKIVPGALEEVAPEFQSQPMTGTIARKFGQAFQVSPAKFEYAVRALTGTLGSDVLRSADDVVDRLAGRAIPAVGQQPSDWPILGRFFARVPSLNVEPIRTFYANAKQATEALNTVRYLRRSEPHQFATYVQDHQQDLAAAAAYEAVGKQFSGFHRRIDAIRRSPGIGGADKRAQTDALVRQMIELARRANAAIAAAKMQRKETPAQTQAGQ